MKAVYDGYGKDFTQVDWNTPDWEMLSKLTQNVFQFSSAKCYQELRDITNALRDENGMLREFAEFRDAVGGIDEKYNRTWLETEYNTAIASATTAARWTEFQREKHWFPMLEYQTVGDDKVRKDHAALNGVKKHADDDFWKIYYPPNGWNCRCEAIQCPDAEAPETPDERITPPAVQRMFQTNLAETGLIFPKGHPYYKGCPRKVLIQSMKCLPADACYTSEAVGNGFVNESLLVEGGDVVVNKKLAKLMAKEYNATVTLLPEFDGTQPELRKRMITDFLENQKINLPNAVKNGFKTPDCILNIDGQKTLLELKGTNGGFSSFDSDLRDANKKSHAVLLHSTTKDFKEIIRDIKNVRDSHKNNIETFYIKTNDGLSKITKGEL